ncbi:MAG TPA: M50 family metallopeptidase, partial [Patescibacteria group bacterium]
PPLLAKLFSWRGTKFTLNAIPFGGFVKLEGEEYQPSDTNASQVPGAFYAKSAWARVAVIFAGPLANILLAILAFSIVFGIMGVPQSLANRPRINLVAPDSPAAKAGLSPNDEIIGFKLFTDEVTTTNIDQVVEFIELNRGQEVSIIFSGPCEGVVCPQERQEAIVYLRTADETPVAEGSMGVAFADFYLQTGVWYDQLWRGIIYGLKEAMTLGILITSAVMKLFYELFTVGKVPLGIAGPVGIVHQASRSQLLQSGWAPLLEFAGILSINLGIMNLLPIPALDGGRILLVLMEKVVGKKRIQNIEGWVNYAGFLLLIGLIVIVSVRDIAQIFQT